MRHVSRTHRVALDWLFDRRNVYPKIPVQHVDTKSQLADMLTNGKFTRDDEWNHLLFLFNIMDISQVAHSQFSSTSSYQTLSKRLIQQEKPGEVERVVAHIETNAEFGVENCGSVFNSAGIEGISQPGDT